MKKTLVICSIVLFTLFGCEKKDRLVCGVSDPATELEWLVEIISLAEKDTTGCYYGTTIYLENYKGNNIFWVNIPIDALAGHWYNCNGSRVSFENNDMPPHSKNKVIYTNLNLINHE